MRLPFLIPVALLALCSGAPAQDGRICPPGGEGCLDPLVLRQLALDIGFGREDFRLPGDAPMWADGRLKRFRPGRVPVEVYSDDPKVLENEDFWRPFREITERLPALAGLRLVPRREVALWDGPPGLMIFVGSRAYLRESLVTLSRIAGGDETLAGERFDALVAPFEMRGRPVCYADMRFRDDRSAELALSLVVLETSEHLAGCVFEEVLQALGPMNDSWRVGETIFNDASAHAAPTAYDWLALSVLYDPRLETGEAKASAEPVIEAIIGDLVGDLVGGGEAPEK